MNISGVIHLLVNVEELSVFVQLGILLWYEDL